VALKLLHSLDRTIHDIPSITLAVETAVGLDDRLYRVCKRNNFLADHYRWFRPPESRQDELSAQLRHTVVVPVDPINEIRISCCDLQFRDERLFYRLLEVRDLLSVMLWPFAARPEFPIVEQLQSGERPPFFVCKAPRNELKMIDEIRHAFGAASENKATILVFPELSITPDMLELAKEILAAQPHDGFPLLAVVGLCHAPAGEGEKQANEAVVLGSDGRELLRHRKLTCFTMGEGSAAWGEDTIIGHNMIVIETPIGNLSILICLDMFDSHCEAAILASHANFLVVPSLSETTSAHKGAAQKYLAHQLAASFVTNQTLPIWDAGKAPSFYRIPKKNAPLMRHAPGKEPFLLFVLDS
jgi:hypothetical protein